jgi:alginate export protein
MQNVTRKAGLAVAVALVSSSVQATQVGFNEALSSGEVYGDFRLRFEQVRQDNALKDAEGLTLRSRLGYSTAEYNGFSGLVEFEDVRNLVGLDDYNNTLGKNGNYSVIADPESTELDQAYFKYRHEDVIGRFGRQVITYDNQRFIGDVGWRQDRQTFDAARLTYAPSSNLVIDYAYLGQRNRIFAESRDLPSNDHIANVAYQSSLGKLTGYAYLLEIDEGLENSLDTFGLRYVGRHDLEQVAIIYEAEYAIQEAESGGADFDAEYYKLNAGIDIAGVIVSAGLEVLGSDNGNYGFSTPLATLHGQNGWADQFLSTPLGGLEDASLSVKASLAGGGLTLKYHDFSASDSSGGANDLGSEVDVAYQRKLSENYSAGVKYARYIAGDAATGKVDTDKLWLTLAARF